MHCPECTKRLKEGSASVPIMKKEIPLSIGFHMFKCPFCNHKIVKKEEK